MNKIFITAILTVMTIVALSGIVSAYNDRLVGNTSVSIAKSVVSPLTGQAPATDTAAAIPFTASTYVDNTVACEISANNADSYPGTGQTVSNMQVGSGCDFYLGDTSSVENSDPDYVSGTPSYFDLPNDLNDLEGTERLTSVSGGSSLNTCMRNVANSNTETTLVAVYNHGDIEHATGALGFASATGIAAILGNFNTITENQGNGITLYNYEGNTVSNTGGNWWGGFSQANDNVISIISIDSGATDTTYKLWTNSNYPDVVVDAAHNATAMADTSQIASTVEFWLSGNASSFNGIRKGRYYYFACIEGLLTDVEAQALMGGLNSEFNIYTEPAAGSYDIRMGGWPGTGDELGVGTQDLIPRGAHFSSNGAYLTVLGVSGKTVETYTCTGNDGNPANCTHSWSCDVTSTTPNLSGFEINREDSRLYVTGQTNDNIDIWNYNPSKTTGGCAADTGNTFDLGINENTPRGMCVDADEDYIILAGTADEALYEITCTGSADLTSCSLGTKVDIDGLTSETYAVNDIACTEDLLQVWTVDVTNDRIRQYNMSTSQDISTLAYESQSRYTNGINTQIQGINLEEEYNQMTYTGNTGDVVGRILLD